MNSIALAETLRHEWGIESFASANIRSLVYNNIQNLTVLWFPMKKNISGCCSKTKDDKVIFINTNHTIGRQNFTLAHEIYHLLYEDVDDFIVCGVNNNSQSEKNADNFASTLLMPDSALYWFKSKNQIEDWSLEDIIKCEQYYQVSHHTMLIRLKNLNWINKNEGKFLSLQGKPQNVVDKNILSKFLHLIIEMYQVTDKNKFTLAIQDCLETGVPTDRFIMAVSTPSLDTSDTSTGFIGTERAIIETAYWITADTQEYDKCGIAINNVQNDYYQTSGNYHNVKKTINIMNPAPTK